MDYFGEPRGTGTSSWPYVSSDFGQFDIAGFPKPHAYWYAANWLQVLLPPPSPAPFLGVSAPLCRCSCPGCSRGCRRSRATTPDGRRSPRRRS